MEQAQVETPFVCRSEELKASIGHAMASEESSLTVMRGDSGTGKTTLLLRVLKKLVHSCPDCICLYVDLQDDEFTTGNIFEGLICLAWNESPTGRLPNPRIALKSSFRDFMRSRMIGKSAIDSLYEGIRETARLVPGLSSLAKVLPSVVSKSNYKLGSETGQIFTDYVAWTTRRKRIILAIDNYQFLSRERRLLLESRLGELRSKLSLILTDRTVRGKSQIEDPLCFPDQRKEIVLRAFDTHETRTLTATLLPKLPEPILDQVAQDCFLKTEGNAKLAQIYLQSLIVGQSSPTDLKESAVRTIEGLPELARTIVMLTSIFTAGLRRPFIEDILRRMSSRIDDDEIDSTIKELMAIGYIVVNGTSGDTLRSHERVIHAMREGFNEEDFDEIRNLTIDSFDQAISTRLDKDEYFYFLHCMIGILHFREAIARLDRLVELLEHQYVACKYEYVVNVYRSFPEIIGNLPRSVVRFVLDSLQRTCEITLGLTAVRELTVSGFEDKQLVELYEAKYLIQRYRYHDALEILDKLDENDDVLLHRLIAIQNLGRDDEARRLIADSLPATNRSESAYIALRNASHLFGFEEARDNLLEVVKAFRFSGNRFAEGTSLNNLGLVYLWHGDNQEAERVLLRSMDILVTIGSHEHIQPMINLGVLEALRGDAAKGLANFERARPLVPRQMTWDCVLVGSNIEVVKLALGQSSPKEALISFREIFSESLAVGDRRLYNLIAYNAVSVERHLGIPEVTAPETSFLAILRKREFTGYEIYLPIVVDGQEIRLLLGLPPQWRH